MKQSSKRQFIIQMKISGYFIILREPLQTFTKWSNNAIIISCLFRSNDKLNWAICSEPLEERKKEKKNNAPPIQC